MSSNEGIYEFPEGHFSVKSRAFNKTGDATELVAAFVDWAAEDVTLELIYHNDHCQWEAIRTSGCAVMIQNVDASDDDENVFFIENGHPTVFLHATDSGVSTFQFINRNYDDYSATETAFELTITVDNEGVIQSVESLALLALPAPIITRPFPPSLSLEPDASWNKVEFKTHGATCYFLDDLIVLELRDAHCDDFAWSYTIYGYAITNIPRLPQKNDKIRRFAFKAGRADKTKIEFYYKSKSLGSEHLKPTFSLLFNVSKNRQVLSVTEES